MTTTEQGTQGKRAVKLYALTRGSWDEGELISRDAATGDTTFRGACDELWDENDFDGLAGFVVFEGDVYTKDGYRQHCWDGDPEEFDSFWDPDWASFHVGSWRQMRVDEAVALGLLAAPAAEACHAE